MIGLHMLHPPANISSAVSSPEALALAAARRHEQQQQQLPNIVRVPASTALPIISSVPKCRNTKASRSHPMDTVNGLSSSRSLMSDQIRPVASSSSGRQGAILGGLVGRAALLGGSNEDRVLLIVNDDHIKGGGVPIIGRRLPSKSARPSNSSNNNNSGYPTSAMLRLDDHHQTAANRNNGERQFAGEPGSLSVGFTQQSAIQVVSSSSSLDGCSEPAAPVIGRRSHRMIQQQQQQQANRIHYQYECLDSQRQAEYHHYQQQQQQQEPIQAARSRRASSFEQQYKQPLMIAETHLASNQQQQQQQVQVQHQPKQQLLLDGNQLSPAAIQGAGGRRQKRPIKYQCVSIMNLSAVANEQQQQQQQQQQYNLPASLQVRELQQGERCLLPALANKHSRYPSDELICSSGSRLQQQQQQQQQATNRQSIAGHLNEIEGSIYNKLPPAMSLETIESSQCSRCCCSPSSLEEEPAGSGSCCQEACCRKRYERVCRRGPSKSSSSSSRSCPLARSASCKRVPTCCAGSNQQHQKQPIVCEANGQRSHRHSHSHHNHPSGSHRHARLDNSIGCCGGSKGTARGASHQPCQQKQQQAADGGYEDSHQPPSPIVSSAVAYRSSSCHDYRQRRRSQTLTSGHLGGQEGPPVVYPKPTSLLVSTSIQTGNYPLQQQMPMQAQHHIGDHRRPGPGAYHHHHHQHQQDPSSGRSASSVRRNQQQATGIESTVADEVAVVSQMYESLAAELKAKLGDPKMGPILLPPKDYDTMSRKQGKLNGIELRRSTNPQLVGPTANRLPPIINGDACHPHDDDDKKETEQKQYSDRPSSSSPTSHRTHAKKCSLQVQISNGSSSSDQSRISADSSPTSANCGSARSSGRGQHDDRSSQCSGSNSSSGLGSISMGAGSPNSCPSSKSSSSEDMRASERRRRTAAAAAATTTKTTTSSTTTTSARAGGSNFTKINIGSAGVISDNRRPGSHLVVDDERGRLKIDTNSSPTASYAMDDHHNRNLKTENCSPDNCWASSDSGHSGSARLDGSTLSSEEQKIMLRDADDFSLKSTADCDGDRPFEYQGAKSLVSKRGSSSVSSSISPSSHQEDQPTVDGSRRRQELGANQRGKGIYNHNPSKVSDGVLWNGRVEVPLKVNSEKNGNTYLATKQIIY